MLETIAAGYTPNELARVLRVSPDRIRAWIKDGSLPALNTAAARCRKPRFVILKHHLATWERSHAAAQPKAPRRRRRPNAERDLFAERFGSANELKVS